MLKGRCALTFVLLVFVGGQARAAMLIIDSVLGEKSKVVAGIESMSQDQIAFEAAQFALAPEGWNLGAVGSPFLFELGPPGWGGGIEWLLADVPAANSEDWGYDLNAEAEANGNTRGLVFHTDDTVYRDPHDVGEPSPFGVISGVMDGVYRQLGVQDWGTFSVEPAPVPEPSSLILCFLLACYAIPFAWRQRKVVERS